VAGPVAGYRVDGSILIPKQERAMPVNVEIKARVNGFARLEARARDLSDWPVEVLNQDDLFFAVPAYRMKLRTLSARKGELILYDRENTPGPKPSHYLIAPTTEPETLKEILTSALGVLGVVKKVRRLYRVGQTRIHLDRVEGLGDFVELEVVLEPEQTEEDGRQVARVVMDRLGISEDDLVEASYLDLLDK
jgi:predicted adenylyl cyclase CyaB